MLGNARLARIVWLFETADGARRFWSVIAVVVAVSSVAAALGGPARAVTIVVNSLADDDGFDHCTLREAVAASITQDRQGTCIAGSGTDTIVFAVGTTGGIDIDSDSKGPIVLTAGFVTIEGGAAGIVIAAPSGTALGVGAGARLEVRNLTFAGAGGSALANEGSLRVSNCTLSGNSSSRGGAIYNRGGTTVINSTFSRNSSGFGGAIYSEGATTVVNSTFSGNTADLGGAIASLLGPLTVINSTFSGNAAAPSASGGAIHAAGSAITLRGTILAGSPGGNCDLRTARINFAPNISDDATCGFGVAMDDVDPQLDHAGLADHGGPTQTIALQRNSPAIDALRPDLCTDAAGAPLATDQRGFGRPAGTACDAGAYEFDADPIPTPTSLPLPPPPTPTATPACAGDCAGDGTVTVDDLMIGVGIALVTQPLSACRAMDRSGDGTVAVDEIIRAVIAALTGCPASSTEAQGSRAARHRRQADRVLTLSVRAPPAEQRR